MSFVFDIYTLHCRIKGVKYPAYYVLKQVKVLLKKTAISIIVAVLIISMSACGMSNNQQKPLNTAAAQASAAPSATQPAAKPAETQSPATATPSNSKNLKDVKGLSLIKEQTFNIDLNSWGNVNFVSGKLTGGAHIPVVFYLTTENGDILYEFNAVLPYSVDVKAV